MRAPNSYFPDLPHLERIRAALWRGRAFGQAAVMVGSGFSRNAEPLGIGAPPFPLWSDLATKLYDGLVPHYGASTVARTRDIAVAAANGGVLRLALEYQTMFGAGALDDLIERVVPDLTYRPGELHRRLLQLPWADVFTTNYDTLLERTLPDVLERRYEVVLAPHDLPGRMKPRIVKLHGTIPTHRPYILHEEDYRTYPAQYGPFVNTVQQSLMETAFVLIGFSGDDPNFLQWLGWVRDRLARVSQPAYLCGLLDLSDARRQMLLDLNVVPVDLTPLFPPDRHLDESARHRRAMRWLLLSLANGAPLDPLDWPNPRTREDVVMGPSEPLPLPGPPPLEAEPAGPAHAVQGEDVRANAERLGGEVVHSWRRKRERYPGWVVLPASNRPLFTLGTEQWSENLLAYLGEMDAQRALVVVSELLWRRGRLGLPLYEEWATDFERVLSGVLLFPDVQQDLGSDLTPSVPDGEDRAYLRECWINVAFALARRGRQDGDNAYDQWMSRLEAIIQQRPEWRAQWHYEKCL